MTNTQFSSTIILAANSTDALRKSDVYRCIEDASDRGYLQAFAKRLKTDRPEFTEEIVECIDDL